MLTSSVLTHFLVCKEVCCDVSLLKGLLFRIDIKLTEIINMKQSNVIKGGNLLAAPEKNANFAPQRA